MSIESLQNYVFTSKYSRYIPEKMRRETFEEAVDRVIDMHRRHYAEKGLEIEDLLAAALQVVQDFCLAAAELQIDSVLGR